MSSEETITQIEVVEQPKPNKIIKIKKKKKLIIINDKQSQDGEIDVEKYQAWSDKYRFKCELANKFYDDINKTYGSSRTTIMDGIDRYELSTTNLSKLNELLNELKKNKFEKEYHSLKSEYIDDIMNSLGEDSLQELLNKCIRKEATRMTLIIVDEKKGWLIVKNINKLSCPRITRGSPRINYS
jgi:hypothetical protein